MQELGKVASDLHVVSDEEARRIFDETLGRGREWTSELMRYRTTSSWQDDWVVEVGNWLARARTLGFLDDVLGRVRAYRDTPGSRDASDEVHRRVSQWLFQLMVAHYFIGTGWGFVAYEPQTNSLRADRKFADVDLQLGVPTGGETVDIQVKASGDLGEHDSVVDARVLVGLAKGISQLPEPPLGPALVVVGAQRGMALSSDPESVEALIGLTVESPEGHVLLHDGDVGALRLADHVSGIVLLDYVRTAAPVRTPSGLRLVRSFAYECVVLMNPWACYPCDPDWFPFASILEFNGGQFSWIRGTPSHTTFPTGTRLVTPRS